MARGGEGRGRARGSPSLRDETKGEIEFEVRS